MFHKSTNHRQEKLLLINRLSLEMSKEAPEEPSTPVLQQQEDIDYFRDLLQVSFTCVETCENN